MIKLLINKNAKKHIKKISIDSEDESFIMFSERWLSEIRIVKCYSMYINEEIVCVALLSKCDFDPIKKHDNPYILDYIFTFPKHRRKKYAHLMLTHIKECCQVTAFCDNDESVNLFENSGFIRNTENVMYKLLPTFRYP